MGTSCVPHLANIFLFMYESKYIKSLVEQGQIYKASLLSKTYRYQDDAIVFNDNGLFKNVYKGCADIYPQDSYPLDSYPPFSSIGTVTLRTVTLRTVTLWTVTLHLVQ